MLLPGQGRLNEKADTKVEEEEELKEKEHPGQGQTNTPV
jgi:hypothetical protein